MSSHGSADVAARLERFYAKYNPEKVSTIPTILKAFEGKEAQLFVELTKRYGPEPPADSAPTAEADQEIPILNDGKDALRTKLYKFYFEFNPNNTGNIEAVVQAYFGQEKKLYAQLAQKYEVDVSIFDDDANVTPAPASPLSSTRAALAAAAASSAANAVAVATTPSYRSRVLRLLQAYLPAKVDQLDTLLEKYKGREEEYIAAVVGKYGPEPPATPQTAAGSATSASPTAVPQSDVATPQPVLGNYRERVLRLLQAYLPAKVDQLDTLLEKYKGREEEYIAAVVGKYGPEPSAASATPSATQSTVSTRSNSVVESTASSHRARIVALLRAHLPTKVDQVEALLEKYKGREEEYIAALVAKYGAEPSTPPPALRQNSVTASPSYTHRDRILRLLEAYLPAKIGQLDDLLEKYKGREEEYIAALVGKYGAEPAASGDATPSTVVDSLATSTREVQPAGSYRERVLRLLRAHLPAKVDQVDVLLEKYKGREEEYIAALVGKYGAEPAASGDATPSTPAAPPRDVSIRDRVLAMLQAYLPAKADQVDALLDKYKGREEEYLAALVAKYGAEPASSPRAAKQALSSDTPSSATVSVSHRDRVLRLLQAYLPSKVDQVDQILAKYAGREEEYIGALVQKYGPEPSHSNSAPATSVSTGSASYADRLTAYFQHYLPAKVGQVGDILAKYAGREEEYMAALVTKYGPEPQLSSNMAASTSAAAAATSSLADIRQRVIRFYEFYQPDKVATVDSVLAKYSGREEELLSALAKRYGPEPQSLDGSMRGGPAESADDDSSSVASGRSQLSSKTSTLRSAPSFKERITSFYKHYQPEKVATVDNVLAKYEGREDELMSALIGKYGPEPAVAETPQENVPCAPSSGTPASPPSSPQSLPPSTQQGNASTPARSVLLPASTSSAGAVDQIATINDEAKRARISSLAASQGITHVDENVLRLLELLDTSMASVKSNVSPRRDTDVVNASVYAPSTCGSPSRCELETESWREHARHVVAELNLQMAALAVVEAEERATLEDLDADERDILFHSYLATTKKMMLRVQLERSLNGTAAYLRRRTFELWMLYAKARKQHRRLTNAKELPAYQRLCTSQIAQRFYDKIKQDELKKEEKLGQLKAMEAEMRAQHVKQQRAMADTRRTDFISLNKTVVTQMGASGMGRRLREAALQKKPGRVASPLRHSIRESIPRVRSPRHSTSVVYLDRHTGTPPVTPVSSGKPHLAKMVALRGGPSPSSRVDFLDRDTRLALIQQQFDLLPPEHKARVFRQLKKWDMVPVLSSATEAMLRSKSYRSEGSSALSDAASYDDTDGQTMFSPSISKRSGAHSRLGGPADESLIDNEPYSINTSTASQQTAMERERMRMEASRADKLFNSPLVDDYLGNREAPGVVHVMPTELGARNPQTLSPRTPASVSYINDAMSPTSAAATAEDEELARGVVERLMFHSAIKSPLARGPAHIDPADGEDMAYAENEEDVRMFMEAALREALSNAR